MATIQIRYAAMVNIGVVLDIEMNPGSGTGVGDLAYKITAVAGDDPHITDVESSFNEHDWEAIDRLVVAELEKANG